MKIKLFKIFKYFKDIIFGNREKYNKYYKALKKFYPEYYLSINDYEEDDIDEEIEGTNLETEKFQYFKNGEVEKLLKEYYESSNISFSFMERKNFFDKLKKECTTQDINKIYSLIFEGNKCVEIDNLRFANKIDKILNQNKFEKDFFKYNLMNNDKIELKEILKEYEVNSEKGIKKFIKKYFFLKYNKILGLCINSNENILKNWIFSKPFFLNIENMMFKYKMKKISNEAISGYVFYITSIPLCLQFTGIMLMLMGSLQINYWIISLVIGIIFLILDWDALINYKEIEGGFSSGMTNCYLFFEPIIYLIYHLKYQNFSYESFYQLLGLNLIFIIYFIIKQRIVYLRVKKVSKYFIDSILGKTYTKELIVENEIQEIKKSDLIENWIKLLKSKLSKLVLKKYVFRKVPEYEGLIEDFIHFESDDKKKILEILKSKGIIEKSKIPKKEKKLLYKRLKL